MDRSSCLYDLILSESLFAWSIQSFKNLIYHDIHKSAALHYALLCIVARLISDVHFHITEPKLTFKTYNYRHCDTSMSPKTADYFPSGGIIATLLGNCKVLCYANMNVTLFRVSANQISVFSITQQSR